MPRETDTRVRIYNFIRDFVHENSCSPTVREIQSTFHLASPRPVQYHLALLEREGLIERVPLKSRGIRLSGTSASEDTEQVPVLGVIAAGKPIPVPTADTWHSSAFDVIDVSKSFMKKGAQIFALRVKGTSMIDALVDDNDTVILEATDSVDDGEMAAVWLTDRQETTLKKVYREKGRIRLQPANQTMAPIYAKPEHVVVQGRVIAVMRKLGY